MGALIDGWGRDTQTAGLSERMSDPLSVARSAKTVKQVGRLQGPSSTRSSPKTTPFLSPRKAAEAGSASALEEALALRELMKYFVQEMMHGKEYNLIMEDGRTEAWNLSITTALQYIKLEANGITHDILLRNIKKIVPGKLADGNFTPGALDDCCTTVVLQNNECVTFRLGSIQERDDFTKCVKVLVLALD